MRLHLKRNSCRRSRSGRFLRPKDRQPLNPRCEPERSARKTGKQSNGGFSSYIIAVGPFFWSTRDEVSSALVRHNKIQATTSAQVPETCQSRQSIGGGGSALQLVRCGLYFICLRQRFALDPPGNRRGVTPFQAQCLLRDQGCSRLKKFPHHNVFTPNIAIPKPEKACERLYHTALSFYGNFAVPPRRERERERGLKP